MLSKFLSLIKLASKPVITLHATPATLVSLDSITGEKKSTTFNEILDGCESLRGNKAFYVPTTWLANGHLSTIYCTIANFDYDEVSYSRTLLRVPDGGTIALDFTPPITPDNPLIEGQTILVALHGLTGGSHESYVRDVMKKVTGKKDEQGLGWRGVVVNFRGCAGSPVTGDNFQLYHGGYTDDLRCALAYLSHLTPQSPLHGIGFSLGANVLAKYLGEEGRTTPLKSGVILGCPFDFYEGHLFLSQGYLKSIYSKAMAKNLRTMLGRHAHIFDHDKRLDQRAIYQNPNQTLYEFDTIVTRVLGGFPSTEAYYNYASSAQYMSNVAVPLLAISSIDDPIVAASTIPLSLTQDNPFLIFVTTLFGGHLGWFEGLWSPRRWIAKPVVQFLREMERADGEMRGHQETIPKANGSTGDVVAGPVREVGNEKIGFQVVVLDELEEEALKKGSTENGKGGKLIQGL